jgi:hypothetical protein
VTVPLFGIVANRERVMRVVELAGSGDCPSESLPPLKEERKRGRRTSRAPVLPGGEDQGVFPFDPSFTTVPSPVGLLIRSRKRRAAVNASAGSHSDKAIDLGGQQLELFGFPCEQTA